MKLIYIEIINVKIEILPKFIFIKLAFIMKSTTSLKPQHKKCYHLKSSQYLLYIFSIEYSPLCYQNFFNPYKNLIFFNQKSLNLILISKAS